MDVEPPGSYDVTFVLSRIAGVSEAQAEWEPAGAILSEAKDLTADERG